MTDRELESRTPDQERAHAALRALPDPPADPEFRRALARSFASGSIAERGGAGGRRGDAAAEAWAARPAVRWVGIPLAFAALLTVVAILNRGPDWSLTEVSGQGIAVIDGRAVPMNHTEDLARAIRPGARIEVPAGAALEITSPGRMMLEITGGTAARIPMVPGRWFARDMTAEIATGEMRITTGREFAGARLAITTPEARIEVTGTTLAVIREPAGTCVCVLEGRVEVGPVAGTLLEVDAGMRRFVFSDGREPELAEMRPVEAVELERLRQRTAPAMGR